MTALADPTRRTILELASKGEVRVTELAKAFTMSLNGVSKHIKILEGAGLLRRRKVGREHLLSVRPEPLAEVANWIETNRALWVAQLDKLDEILQAEGHSLKENQ